MNYLGEHLTGRINMDGNRFDKCIFRDALLVYSGGRPPILINNDFARCSFLFEGGAANTIRFLTAMRRIGFRDLVDSTLYNIKTGHYHQAPGQPRPGQVPRLERDVDSKSMAADPENRGAITAEDLFRARVVCECGHEGRLKFDAQDYESSGSVWGLEGFKYKGVSINYRGPITRPNDLLEQLQAECPSCGKVGTIRYG
jgi:hypothetical protein